MSRQLTALTGGRKGAELSLVKCSIVQEGSFGPWIELKGQEKGEEVKGKIRKQNEMERSWTALVCVEVNFAI